MRLPAVLLVPIVALVSASAAAEDARVVQGRALYEAKCQRCHGRTAEHGEAGDIRGLPVSVVTRATRGIEEMPAVKLSKAEIAAIVAYLEHLAGG